MKKLIGILLLGLVFCAGGRHSDRDWTVYQLEVNANAQRATNLQSGMLWIENHGADAYIAINATADITDMLIPDGSSIDFYPASVKFGEYFTVYSAGTTSINYMILD